MKLRFLFLVLTAHTLSHAQDEQSFIGEKLLPSSAQISQAVLGKGYDAAQERFAGDCMTGAVQYIGAPHASVSFERSLSSSEMNDSLGFSVGARARYGMVSGSAAARFASESISNEYSEVTIYSSEYRFKNAKLTKPVFSEQGITALNGHKAFVGEIWEKTCGQGYVEQIELGAKFMVSAKVEFSTKEDRHSFAAEFKIKGPAFAVRGELSKASARFGKSASVTIRAFQLGGDVSRMSALFGVGEKARVDLEGQKVHALLVCSMDQMGACLQVLDNAISYGTDTEDPGSFPNQVKPVYDPTQPAGPAELGYVVKPWSDVAVYLQPQIMKAATMEARTELSRRFEELLKQRIRVIALLSGPFRLSSNQYDQVDRASNILSANLVTIKNAVELCYSQPEKCAERVARLKEELLPLPLSSFEVYPESFAQWCDLYESGVIRSSAKSTVDALLKIAEPELDKTSSIDKCLASEAILKEKREIDLAMLGIENLKPLADFRNVETLYLYHNRISDLGPLRKLTSLRKLNLNANQVSDLTSLKNLENLEVVYLGNNRIEYIGRDMCWSRLRFLTLGDNRIKDLSFLSTLSGLEKLDLSNNQISLIDAVGALSELRELSLANNRIRSFTPLLGLSNLQELHASANPGQLPDELKALDHRLEL